jgi:hypothetical protein
MCAANAKVLCAPVFIDRRQLSRTQVLATALFQSVHVRQPHRFSWNRLEGVPEQDVLLFLNARLPRRIADFHGSHGSLEHAYLLENGYHVLYSGDGANSSHAHARACLRQVHSNSEFLVTG